MPPIPPRLQGHPNVSSRLATSKKPSPQDYVIFTTTSPRLSVRALLNEGTPLLTAGTGGWQETARPKRRALAEWQGHPLLRMNIDIILDGWAVVGDNGSYINISVEQDITNLWRMATSPGPGVSPPIVRAQGPAIPRQDVRWAIDGLDEGDVIRDSKMVRMRQLIAVSLVQVPRTDQISALAAQLTGSAPKGSTYTIKEGDTLRKIAEKELDDGDKWRDIVELNSIRETRRLKPGTVLRLP